MANDTDPETGGGVANLDALLVTPPAHGQLALAADGSFVYTPAKNYFGDDFFTYLADDRQSSNNTSPPATVRLVVEEESDLAVAITPLRESLVSESPAREAFRVTVINRGPSRVTGLRLAELAASDAGSLVVTGRTASAGVVQSSTGIWTIEFFDPLRRATLSPGYLVEILPEPAARLPAPNSGFAARGPFPQPDGGRLIEWNAAFGRRYAVQYSDDMTSWHQVEPTVTTPANRVQWVDDGPPKTASHPGTVAQRYYRIVELPPPG